jgi:hypothetical protein
MRGDGTRVVEESTGVGPLLESHEAGNENRDGARELPHPQDQQEVVRVAEVVEDTAHVVDLQQVPHRSRDHLESDDKVKTQKLSALIR